jgi:hypothetical protein
MRIRSKPRNLCHMRYVLLMLIMIVVLSQVSSPAWAADTTYRDQRQPSFALLVPDGWTANRTDQGVTLSHGNSYFQLIVLNGASPPGAMLVQIRPQLERQFKDFRELQAGEVPFGGLQGGYVVYSGVPPSGIPSLTRVVSMNNGKLTFLAFEGVSVDEVKVVTPQLDRIERSFTPDPVR